MNFRVTCEKHKLLTSKFIRFKKCYCSTKKKKKKKKIKHPSPMEYTYNDSILLSCALNCSHFLPVYNFKQNEID